ncbi:MAG: hypothetical protein KBF63_07350, partial [Rhodoferax sp.]|nr:hypothetical protein [Rhodoferax sp.]
MIGAKALPRGPEPAGSTLPAIDWSRPWLAPLRQHGQSVEQACTSGSALHQALNQAGPAPVQFA